MTTTIKFTEPQQQALALARETIVRRHQLRGSVLPILTMCYNKPRQHLLTADEQALRLFSTRRELAVLWLDPESPSPTLLLHHAAHDVYVVAYDDEPAKHPDAGAIQVLHASLAPLLRWRPHDGAVATGAATKAFKRHRTVFGRIAATPRGATWIFQGGGSRRRRGARRGYSEGDRTRGGRPGPRVPAQVATATLHEASGLLVTSGAEGQLRLWKLAKAPAPAGDDAEGQLVVSPVASLNEHQARGAIATLHAAPPDLLIGAIEGTVWVWRLFPGGTADGSAPATPATPQKPVPRLGAPAPPTDEIQPRLVLCYEAGPGPESDDDAPPAIACADRAKSKPVGPGRGGGSRRRRGRDVDIPRRQRRPK